MATSSIDVLKTFPWEIEARRLLKGIATNSICCVEDRLLAWAKLKAWGNGREYACCRVGDMEPTRADVIVFRCWDREQIPQAKNELVVASQQQCARELGVSVNRVRVATSRLVNSGLLTTKSVQTRSFVTKYKLGVGFRAHLATKDIQAFYPVPYPITDLDDPFLGD